MKTFCVLGFLSNKTYLTTWSKNVQPPNLPKTLKSLGFSKPTKTKFPETWSRSRNGHFWTQKHQNPKFQFHFLLFGQKTQKSQKLLLCSVSASKSRLSQNQTQTGKLKRNWDSISKKRTIFTKLPDNWAKKNTHKMITECSKIAWKHYNNRLKTNLAQIITLTWPR